MDTGGLMAFLAMPDGATSPARWEMFSGGNELTLRTAAGFAWAFREHLAARTSRIEINLEGVKIVDVAGLATLLQAAQLAAERGVHLSILPSAAVLHGSLETGIVEDLPLIGPREPESGLTALWREGQPDEDPEVTVVRTGEFALRRVRWEDLSFFEQWAHDPNLKIMVGSELLYRCRYLGPYHPEFASSVLHHPASLTLILQSAIGQEVPLGFVRLFGIHLGQGYGFLEAAIVSRQAVRRGWGVAASRMLSFYAQDLLGIRRIEAKVYDYNRLSINALRRNGFVQEGVLRGAAIHHGISSDILVFSILEHEIRKQRKRDALPYLGVWGSTGGPTVVDSSRSALPEAG
jgi:[ribosomal protein S5]-alanine N-acetyltransferase